MLYSRRKRITERTERESAGENLWTDEFSERARIKIERAFRSQFLDNENSYDYKDHQAEALAAANKWICHDEGLDSLLGGRYHAADEMAKYLRECPDVMMPTVVEAFARISTVEGHFKAENVKPFAELANDLLREERIGFELVADEMIPIGSRELHVGVVAPAITLLGGDERYADVERSYVEALEEIAAGKPDDAITDAGRALEQLLDQLGATGNALGPKISKARSQGLLMGHDAGVEEAIVKLCHWVSADRSQSGDAHRGGSPTLDDAWLTVHIVGALILRLTKGPRSTND